MIGFFKKPLGMALGLLLFVVLAWSLFAWVTSGQRAKVEARLKDNNTEATLDSVDAANAEAAKLDKLEREVATQTKELADEVRAAPAGDSNDAADHAVCKLRVYRDSERCTALR